MSLSETVTLGYERWAAQDVDGFLGLFDDDAVFVVPGTTSLSGDHDKESFRRVLDTVGEATRMGRHRQQEVCRYESDGGVAVAFDSYVADSGKYHSMHEWIFKNGRPHVWMLYVHEYELFSEAWR